MADNAKVPESGQSTILIPLAVPYEPRNAVLQSNPNTSTDSSLWNCLVENSAGGPQVLKRPGLSTNTGLSSTAFISKAQGFFFFGAVLYQIAGGVIYNTSTGATTLIPGGHGSDSPPTVVPIIPGVSVAVHFNTGLYTFTSAGVITTVTSANYPSSSRQGMVLLDGTYYVISTSDNTIRGSALQDPTTWNALNFIGTDISFGNLLVLNRHLNYLVALCEHGIQFFYDSGAATGSPLLPVGNASWTTGINTIHSLSVVEYSDSMVFVSQNGAGGFFVVSINGLSQTRISTPYIERLIDGQSTFSAYGLHVNGHDLYVLGLTDYTLVYDMVMGTWVRWTSSMGGLEQTIFFPTTAIANPGIGGGNFVQNPFNLRIELLDPGTYTDTSQQIVCRIRTPNIIFGSLQKKRFGALFLHADTLNPITAVAGVGLFVSHSDMDYRSFSATRFINMTTQRKQLQRNGSSRRRAWEFLYVDANPFRASHVELNVEGGPLS